MQHVLKCALAALLVGCQAAQPLTVDPDLYRVRHPHRHDLPAGRLYATDEDDTLRLVQPGTGRTWTFGGENLESLRLFKSELDVDVFTLPFKIRPAREGVPPQLNSNFNAAVYLGRRLDVYRFRTRRIAPGITQRQLREQGFGYGLFAGLGSTSINPFVTRDQVTLEYDGLIVDAGLAAIYDARVFNVGLAVGVDHLMDPNRRHWIYQRKPWFGVLFGLNLN
jgi:hypothetical protein